MVGFSLALGSSWSDSLASALSGLVAGLVFQLIGSKIHTGFLLTIMGSAAIALTANVLYALGLGQHRSLIILGALMVLVPGAFFVNSVREFSQNNFSTGLSLLMSALLTCFSISVGIAATIALLPFAEQMTTPFSNVTHTWWEGLVKVIMAGVGTIAFSLLYHVPKRYFGDLGILGALSWFLYLFINQMTEIEAMAVLFPALFVAFFSRVLAAKRKSPMTIFLSTSIFPLIPGLGFYRAIYFLITGMDNLALTYMRSCFITAFTIAIAISIVQQIPLDYFTKQRMK
ncbi:hypothetical protein FC36_GL001241 [Ligilactobacillus equi DSM 15833 = JCM 10991]|uniref:Integral membrane protein n=1 Tax=Ligilactobacillus equi DSM 15833 = JCM 10991 TaxID=1423740 RepID=A0A0R1TGU2_9LACO|nr:hypothetical protein FC36_GL001241 [Ligilactobacillus equi DSM 15833 = JCM 10991]